MQLFFNTNIQASRTNASSSSSALRSASKLKVLFVIDTLETGGAEKSLLENISRFRGIEAAVCHIYEGAALKDQFAQRGIPVYSLGVKKRYGFIQSFFKLRRVVSELRPNVIVACLTRSEIISRCVAKLSGIAVLGTFVSDLYHPTYNANLNWKAKFGVRLFQLINRLTARFCSGFIANSEAIKISNAKYLNIDPDRIAVINRGRDRSKFAFRSNTLFSIRPIRFLNVGRLVPVKGQQDLILAFSRFVKSNPGAQLHIYGSGICHTALSKLITDNSLSDSVFLRGTDNNISQVMQNFDCLVFPSLSEGFSGTLVEGLFSGLPILASDIAANQEVITHMRTGYLFKTGSVDSICEAMTWFKDNRYTAYLNATAGYEVAKQKFDLDMIAGSFEKYIADSLNKRS